MAPKGQTLIFKANLSGKDDSHTAYSGKQAPCTQGVNLDHQGESLR